MNTLLAKFAAASLAMLLAACTSSDAPKRIVLPLDHGPRAQTTPWENKQRLLKAEQEARAKVEAEKASKASKDTQK